MSPLLQPDPPALTVWQSPQLAVHLTFMRCGDRYAHRLELHTSRGTEMLLVSHEGNAQQAWPPSPPLQQVTRHESPGTQPCVLSLGMAGKSHWSLSVEQNAPGALVFDAACRAQTPPDWLGSSYRFASGANRLADGSWELPSPQRRLRIAVEACTPATRVTDGIALDAAAEDEGSPIRRPVTGGVTGLAIVADAHELADRWPATVRWQYRLRLIVSEDAEHLEGASRPGAAT